MYGRKLLIAVAGALMVFLAVQVSIGLAAFVYLFFTQLCLHNVTVSGINATYERVGWETAHPATGSVEKFVQVEIGHWKGFESVGSGNMSREQSVVTDLHSVSRLRHMNETIAPGNITGYRVSVYA
ncbi:MAG: hypothetical protein ABEJ07_00515 [Candidatus Nanohaloarchaea archaeon]